MEKMTDQKMLVLFDIDGTLISHDGGLKYEMTNNSKENKYYYALNRCLGIDPPLDFLQYSGTTDRNILWQSAQCCGISRQMFDGQFPAMCQAMFDYFKQQTVDSGIYGPIPAAHDLVTALAGKQGVVLATITGNVAQMAAWKLGQTSLRQHFSFGLSGDEAEDRMALAGMAFERARQTCGIRFAPEEVTVIGDTVQDVRCGKAIGAYTIAVNTGGADTFEVLRAQQPDLAVASLGDERVYQHFGLG